MGCVGVGRTRAFTRLRTLQYDGGVDAAAVDRLGFLNLSPEGLLRRDLYVLNTCVDYGIPVATVIGGGYGDDDELASRHAIVFRAARDVWASRLAA